MLFTSKKVINGTGAGSIILNEASTPDFTEMNDTLKTALNPDVTYSADNIVKYVMGECLETDGGGNTCGTTLNTNYRDRRLTVDGSQKVWKLGDIISSTPKVFANTPVNTYHVDYGDTTYYNYISSSDYKQKSSIAFVGANDGMLHAFRVGYLKDKTDLFGALIAKVKALFKNLFSSADTAHDQLGEEVWGFIPYNAFPYLKYLANPNYCHIYYNDLSVRLVDASIGDASASPTDTKTTNSWKTILVGGMRFGGAPTGGTPAPPSEVSNVGFSSFYAIDVTNPEHPVPLWEFSTRFGILQHIPSIIRSEKGGRMATGRGDRPGLKAAAEPQY
jgi:type IV pilus assembly protein PilY1